MFKREAKNYSAAMWFGFLIEVSSVGAVDQVGLHVTREKIDLLLKEVRQIQDVRCSSDMNAQLICDSPSMRAIWTFTTPEHPAHPAVVQRILSAGEGKIGITRTGYWAGDGTAFSRWFQIFAALDKKQVEEWAQLSDAYKTE